MDFYFVLGTIIYSIIVYLIPKMSQICPFGFPSIWLLGIFNCHCHFFGALSSFFSPQTIPAPSYTFPALDP